MSDIKFDDIWELWRVGKVMIPKIAVQYGKSAQDIHRSAENHSRAFDGSESDLPEAFAELRQILQDDVLVVTQTNLLAVGDTLTQIATNFAELDEQHASQLKTEITDLVDTIPIDSPPTYIPEAPSSTDGALTSDTRNRSGYTEDGLTNQ